jgi:DNA-directed RNA polymerase subunit RPC12/RpoP
MSQSRSYRCAVCRWQGRLEPIDAGDAAPCPNCGVYLYPLPWGQTWGVAILLVAATLGFVAAAVFLMR